MTARTRRWIGGAALVAALIGGGAAIAIGASGDEDRPLTGPNLERAEAAALRHIDGGTVIETEVGDDGAAYSVEIRLEDGSVVEVNLDEGFDVIGQEADEDGAEDPDAGHED